MPEPLHIPPTVNAQPSKPGAVLSYATAYSLACVSVVMIARAASWAPSRESAAAACGTPCSKGSISRGTPMTPVEATSTSPALQPRASATTPQVSRAMARPGSPVAALALPELMTTARIVPYPCSIPPSCSRLTCTGAAQNRLVVKTPAAATGRSATTSARSARPGSFENRHGRRRRSEALRTRHAAPSDGAQRYGGRCRGRVEGRVHNASLRTPFWLDWHGDKRQTSSLLEPKDDIGALHSLTGSPLAQVVDGSRCHQHSRARVHGEADLAPARARH